MLDVHVNQMKSAHLHSNAGVDLRGGVPESAEPEDKTRPSEQHRPEDTSG